MPLTGSVYDLLHSSGSWYCSSPTSCSWLLALYSSQVADPSDGACDAVGVGIALQRLHAMLLVSEWKEFAGGSNAGEGENAGDEGGPAADSNTLLRSLHQLLQSALSLGLLKVLMFCCVLSLH